MSKHNGDHETSGIPAEQLTAYALGQLHGDELADVKAKLSAAGSEAALAELRQIQATAAALSVARHAEPMPEPSAELRELVEQRLFETAENESAADQVALADQRKKWWKASGVLVGVGGGVCCLLIVALWLPAFQLSQESGRRLQSANTVRSVQASTPSGTTGNASPNELRSEVGAGMVAREIESQKAVVKNRVGGVAVTNDGRIVGPEGAADSLQWMVTPRIVVQEEKARFNIEAPSGEFRATSRSSNSIAANPVPQGDSFYIDPAAPPPSRMDLLTPRPPVVGRRAKAPGERRYGGAVPNGVPYPESSQLGFQPRVVGHDEAAIAQRAAELSGAEIASERIELSKLRKYSFQYEKGGTEQYAPIFENRFLTPAEQPLSTFSIDVDTASYANVRRFLTSGRLPPPDSVRIEELVNYFRYEYPQPKAGQPFSVNMEVAECPWSEGHKLLRVGLKGREVERTRRPASNLVFLLDVSGSMADANKLPLLKTAMQMLVRELGENDRVAIVTYAGEAGLKLPSTGGHEQEKILAAIESLRSGGSTNGSAGIELAYNQAAAHFIPEGTNRVILCTDGDLNVGVTSDDALVKLIKQKATGGTFLTVLGFGEGNLKDAKMEKLADNGNGLYAYIDSVREARKVLVEQLTGSTITIAKDVKIQIEFNPAQVASYRLLGYENRVLAAEDFNNDKKDAGEIGAGHTVTALYELVPVGAASEPTQPQPGTDPLKYQGSGGRVQGSGFRVQQADPPSSSTPPSPQSPAPSLTDAASTGELLTLKLRYKEPDGDTSKLLEYPLKDHGRMFHSASPDMQFAAAVASLGMILRGSQHRGTAGLAAVEEIASTALGSDAGGYRAEFVDLVRKAQSLGAR